MRRFVLTSLLLGTSLAAASCRRVHLRPGTGGLRVRVNGAGRNTPVHVWITEWYAPTGGWTPRHQIARDSEALFVDLPPTTYRIVAYDEQGGGGYYSTWGGNDTVEVRAGSVTNESVSLDAGRPARGRVIDAVTRAPIANVYITPPTRTASSTWPVALPWFWTVTDATGAFVLGGLPAPGVQGRPSSPIFFRKAGYVDQSIELPPAGATNWTVELVPGSGDGAH